MTMKRHRSESYRDGPHEHEHGHYDYEEAEPSRIDRDDRLAGRRRRRRRKSSQFDQSRKSRAFTLLSLTLLIVLASLLQISTAFHNAPLPPFSIPTTRQIHRHLKSSLTWEQTGSSQRRLLQLQDWGKTRTNPQQQDRDECNLEKTKAMDNSEFNNNNNNHLHTQQSSTTAASASANYIEDVDSDPPHASHNPLQAPLKHSRLDLWKKRLITKQDYKHLHKLSSAVFVLASLGLTAYGVVDLIHHGWTRSITCHGKPFVALLLLLLSSTLVQASSSVSLAWKHRRGQPAVRNTFWSNAVVAVLGSVCALWVTPYYPMALNGTFSRAFYVVMNGLGLLGMADNALRLKDLIASRQQPTKYNNNNNNGQMSRISYWKDCVTYMMPIWIGLPFFLGMLWTFGIQHDRTFYLQLLQRPGHPHLHGGAVYANIMVAMGASYSSLMVTLRDKKLIGKKTEMGSLTAIMLAVAASLYQSLRDPGTVSMFFFGM